MAIEDTDLERRVLAHEQILQALIVHMAETQPAFLERLEETFGDPARQGRDEHDYTDTASYAGQFIRQVIRLSEAAPPLGAAPVPVPAAAADPGPVASRVHEADAPRTTFGVVRRSGVWTVTKDGGHYGDYLAEQPAIDAALAAFREIASAGGRAEMRRLPKLVEKT